MTSDDSVYRAPTSSLEREVEGNARSLEDAIAGNYSFELADVLNEAWALTKGSKLVLFGAWLLTLLLSFAGNLVTALLAAADMPGVGVISGVLSLASVAVTYAVNGGMFVYAIKRAAGDESASFEDIFSCFGILLPIIGLMLLYMLLGMLGMLLFIIPGVYLIIGYAMALPLKVERGLGIWEALETSRKTVHHNWFKVAATMLVAGLAMGFGTIFTLGIGLIWLMPFMLLVSAVMYREMFGYSGGA